MAAKAWKDSEPAVIEARKLQDLIEWLIARGYEVIAPTLRHGVIGFAEVHGADELPAGWTDSQAGGHYRTAPRGDAMLFGYNNGPVSLKSFLFPADRKLLTLHRQGREMSVEPAPARSRPQAFIGCRACDLAAVARLDRVLLEGPYADPDYASRRKAAFFVAVNCATVSPTCFCASTDTGPRPRSLYDLCLTEYLQGDRHHFVVETGSALGARALAALDAQPAPAEMASLPQTTAEAAEARLTRRVDVAAGDLLAANREHPMWDEVGARCLTCGNCTSVCPTCFCHTVEDTTNLDGTVAERRRKWDSCFTMGFSFVNGGSVRYSAASRYRQWLTHKFQAWKDQFGTIGCVGCGRCLTWCPVGIDVGAQLEQIATASRPLKEGSNGNAEGAAGREPALSRS